MTRSQPPTCCDHAARVKSKIQLCQVDHKRRDALFSPSKWKDACITVIHVTSSLLHSLCLQWHLQGFYFFRPQEIFEEIKSVHCQSVTGRAIDKDGGVRKHTKACTHQCLVMTSDHGNFFPFYNLANWIFKQVRKFTLRKIALPPPPQRLIFSPLSLYCSFSSWSICCVCFMLCPLFSQPHRKWTTLCCISYDGFAHRGRAASGTVQ